MIYQLMFAVITPALISGAYAERMKFSAMRLFTTSRGERRFPEPLSGRKSPDSRFCGPGKREGYLNEAMKPHNLTVSVIGACLLWVGWFGFNAGGATAASGLATSAFINRHFAGATAALGWMVAEWMKSGKPSMLGGISGAVAGLVAITPASGFVQPMPALLIGLLAILSTTRRLTVRSSRSVWWMVIPGRSSTRRSAF
jgi:ammonium transporter, Amt family